MIYLLLAIQNMTISLEGELTDISPGWVSVQLPENISAIKTSFVPLNSTLRSFDFGRSSITELPNKCFFRFVNLRNVNLEFCDNLKEIPMLCFHGCSNLSSIVIPKNVRSIYENAFTNCINLKSVTFAQRTAPLHILKYAFSNIGLDSIDLPPTTKTLLPESFNNCHNLSAVNVISSSFRSIDGIIYNYKLRVLIFYPSGIKEKTFTIPDSVKEISGYAFSGNRYLEKVIFNKNIEQIKFNAFSLCFNLQSADFPEGLRFIENMAFASCSKLRSVIFRSSCQIDNFAFEKCKSLSSITFMEVNSNIQKNSFHICNITSITAPPSMVSILEDIGFNKTIINPPQVRVQIRIIENSEIEGWVAQ
ncbi:surface antigen BspA-like [Trichomonas vaginalis G3]|uniref:Surface antigen BspA-like n=1 Tax=Trichomonas vaginalis (strain ATCC PRA-98 / G3) TaxID=412133 RepID=A2DWI7_TRIV3|nr:ribonuclease inhibitor domain-containing protein [Trichomonas vaginalis G3]EAY15172.1 surface antigen BspA-like [Trichomonas vaginalis G3]KAI5550678.1 ribonuclease inhibitor domain-containing protein [Trichomonas vaginalis G3]|eukprot:XP_001327395.1 surface antigen BspA-like [Trichomonas vaginalis G3]